MDGAHRTSGDGSGTGAADVLERKVAASLRGPARRGRLGAMPSLVLGPLLRYVGDGCATVWVETDAPVRGRGARLHRPTFSVAGHSYALVVVSGLPEDGDTAVRRAPGRRRQVWPLPGSGGRRARSAPGGATDPVRLPSGRAGWPAPLDDEASGVDALHALAERMRGHRTRTPGRTRCCWSATRSTRTRTSTRQTRAFIEGRRDTTVGAGPRGRRRRGVHPALPALLVGGAGALAAVDGAVRDGLRRPRRPRRLEHLAGLAGA